MATVKSTRSAKKSLRKPQKKEIFNWADAYIIEETEKSFICTFNAESSRDSMTFYVRKTQAYTDIIQHYIKYSKSSDSVRPKGFYMSYIAELFDALKSPYAPIKAYKKLAG